MPSPAASSAASSPFPDPNRAQVCNAHRCGHSAPRDGQLPLHRPRGLDAPVAIIAGRDAKGVGAPRRRPPHCGRVAPWPRGEDHRRRCARCLRIRSRRCRRCARCSAGDRVRGVVEPRTLAGPHGDPLRRSRTARRRLLRDLGQPRGARARRLRTAGSSSCRRRPRHCCATWTPAGSSSRISASTCCATSPTVSGSSRCGRRRSGATSHRSVRSTATRPTSRERPPRSWAASGRCVRSPRPWAVHPW